MAEAQAQTTETDLFQTQKQTIETLINVLQEQGSSQPQQIIYASPSEPAAAPPNYLLYITISAIIFVIWSLLKKR